MIDNVYIKVVIVLTITILITFSNVLSVTKNPLMIYFIGILLILALVYNITKDKGVIILLSCLFVAVYNQVLNQKHK